MSDPLDHLNQAQEWLTGTVAQSGRFSITTCAERATAEATVGILIQLTRIADALEVANKLADPEQPAGWGG
jgi:hypothetical protein